MKATIAILCACALLIGTMSAQAQEEENAPGAGGAPPADALYAGRKEALNCLDFASQAAAQHVLREDPSDPSWLDADHDGIACELNPEPRDLNPVRH